VLNRLVCRFVDKMLWAMKLIDFMVSIFFLIILNELFLIRFDRFVKILED